MRRRGTLEKTILLDNYGRWLWVMRVMPTHAIHWLSGIFLPPHERFLINLFFNLYKDNVIVASRGTSKSFTFASLGSPIKSLLFKNIRVGVFSASGFRGGKLLFQDIERLFSGELKSQRLPGDFLAASISTLKTIKKDASMWSCTLRSHSDTVTAPTNDPEKLRGIRANTILVDERNIMDGSVVEDVLRPMANVKQDFRRTAAGGEHNQLFQISTIDYQTRDFYYSITKNRRVAINEWKAVKARKGGDWREHDRLFTDNNSELKLASSSYSRFDYTDLIIPKFAEDSSGRIFEINFPLYSQDSGAMAWDERDQVTYYYSYPVDKAGLEEPMNSNDGVDEESWMAEQRNIFIRSAGNVFSPDLLQKVSERPIYESGEIPKHNHITDEWYAPVMYTCGDPCVLGIDYARQMDEFGLIVIRLGELAKTVFDPHMSTKDNKSRTLLGKTPWNHIVWAETHKNWTSGQAADKVREMLGRYNIVYSMEAGGMGLDQGGGGLSVRDDLARPKPPVIDSIPDPSWVEPIKLYDPEDKSYKHYAGFEDPSKYWAGLRLLAPTNQDNIDWTYATRGMMQAKKLFIAYWQPYSCWTADMGLTTDRGTIDYGNPEFLKLQVGYDGIRRLNSQLSKIQIKVTETGVMRFVMPKARESDEGKKDLYSSAIYGAAMARQHLVLLTKGKTEPPMVQPRMVTIGSDYKGKDPYQRRTIFGGNRRRMYG